MMLGLRAMASDRDAEWAKKVTPESENPRRWKSEGSLASDPSTGMDAALR